MNTNTQSPLTRAWKKSVERSPLLNAYRNFISHQYAKAKSRDLLDEADLPKSLHILIGTTVQKTKLWRSERAEITQELIAHTQDALDAGRTPKQITDTFGQPKKVAKLLCRATKRKRPLYWRTMRNIRRGVVSVTLILFVSYAGLAVRFFTGKPNIKTNYVVLINSQNDAYTEDKKAWPIYQDVDANWELHTATAFKQQQENAKTFNYSVEYGDEKIEPGFLLLPDLPTDHHDYQEIAQLFRDFEPQFRILREAAHHPVVGVTLGFHNTEIQLEDGTTRYQVVPPSDNPDENPSLNNLLLPHLGMIRQFSNLLSFDALIAAREYDAQRTYENLSAILALARQQSFDDTLISCLVDMAMADVAIDTIAKVINEHPGLLTREQLVALSHELSVTQPAAELAIEGEIRMFEDLFQRIYTDDGKGNGQITIDGLRILTNYDRGTWSEDEMEGSNTQLLAGPVSLALIRDRKSESALYYSMVEDYRRILHTGPRNIALIEGHRYWLQANMQTIPGVRYSLVELIQPAMGMFIERSFRIQMHIEATMTMLAIEIYFLDLGRHPESLEDLTPTYLPSLPIDIFNPGEPLIYKSTNTGYLIYSIGDDGFDNDGFANNANRYNGRHFLNDRFPPTYDQENRIMLDSQGNPIPGQPTGEEGDYILIDVTKPKIEREPDQSPALVTN